MKQADIQRLQHICEYCTQIRNTIHRFGKSFEIFDTDPDYQQSISFSILQIGELVGNLSEEYRISTTKSIQWGPIKGMRNMVAHGYGKMNRSIIWETAVNDIPVLQQFCDEQITLYSAVHQDSAISIQQVAKQMILDSQLSQEQDAPEL